MNKSQEFVINCIKDGRCSDDFVLEEFEDASCYSPFELLSERFYNSLTENIMKTILHGKTIRDDIGESNITVKYDPDAEFDYFTSDICVHDGSLVFLAEGMCNILNKILSVGTYNISDQPDNWDSHFWDYDYEYTIGDFVVVNNFSVMNATKEKPWAMDKQIIALPIKWRYIKKE